MVDDAGLVLCSAPREGDAVWAASEAMRIGLRAAGDAGQGRGARGGEGGEAREGEGEGEGKGGGRAAERRLCAALAARGAALAAWLRPQDLSRCAGQWRPCICARERQLKHGEEEGT